MKLLLIFLSTVCLLQNAFASCEIYVPSPSHYYSKDVGGLEWARLGFDLPSIGDLNLDDFTYSVLTSKGYKVTFLENLPPTVASSDPLDRERISNEIIQKSYSFLNDGDFVLNFKVYLQMYKRSGTYVYFAYEPIMNIVDIEDSNLKLREIYSHRAIEKLNWLKFHLGVKIRPEKAIKRALEYFPTCSELILDRC
ncbi:MAG: hypothetical protein ABIQ95_01260 [Bdellovibrionia bacterium]